MANINLLPWREELRKERLREFVSVAIGSVFILLTLNLYWWWHVNGDIEQQNGRNTYLNKKVEEYDKKIREIKDLEKKKDLLLQRMKIIQRLQRSRPEVVHVFDEIVRLLPDGLFLTKIQDSNNNITMSGAAQSNARVSAFMRNLDDSKWFTRPNLQQIVTEHKGGQKSSNFGLVIGREQPSNKKEEKPKG